MKTLKHTNLNECGRERKRESMCVHMCVNVRVCMCVCVCVRVRAYVRVCAYLSAHKHLIGVPRLIISTNRASIFVIAAIFFAIFLTYPQLEKKKFAIFAKLLTYFPPPSFIFLNFFQPHLMSFQ